jgi:hypothetical protein
VNAQQTAQVLAKMATYDARNVADVDVLAWHEIIGHLRYDDCLAAIGDYYREQSTRAMPADIRKLATARSAARRGIHDRALRQITTRRSGDPSRTGAAMCRYVLDQLRAAGQDVAAGRRLGRERAGDIAEAACREWLRLTAELP